MRMQSWAKWRQQSHKMCKYIINIKWNHIHKWRQDCCKTCKWKWKVLLIKFACDTTISKQVSCLKKIQIPNLCPSPIVVHSRLSSYNLECKQFNLTHKWNVNYLALKPQHAIFARWSSKSIKSKHTQVKVNIRMWIELGWQSEELKGAKVLVDLITKMLPFYCYIDEYLDAMDNNLGCMSCLHLHLLPSFAFLSNRKLERQHHQEKKGEQLTKVH